MALKYHPDRCTNDNDASSSTLKFQAVSAAYQILMDVKRRTAYDKTGQVIEEQDDEVPNNNNAPSYASQQQQTQWEQFFHSVFNEIITTGTNHVTSAKSYRGSSAEMKDVLYYYKMCKGDIEKVVDCIIHGTTKDIVRWKKDVIQPALDRGEIDHSFDGERSGHSCRRKAAQCATATKQKRRRILDDSSSSSEDSDEIIVNNKKKLGGKKSKPKQNALLVDTNDKEDDSDDEVLPTKSIKQSSKSSNAMSKRDKLAFRVAKKRKAKAVKEMEIADIIQSKNWDASAFRSASHQGGRKKKKNMGNISDELLGNIERKYGGKKTTLKKRR